MMQGPDLEQLEKYSEALRAKALADSRPGRRRHHAERRQAGDVGAARSAEGRRPRRADRRCRRSAAPAGRRRSGDDLQRGRRAVRGAPARRGDQPQLHGGDRRAARAVVAARHRRARQHRDVRARRLAGDDQPHGPPAAGDADRQHAARHVAGHGAGADRGGRRRARTSGPSIAPTSPAARAS